jgi:hypothetical protein
MSMSHRQGSSSRGTSRPELIALLVLAVAISAFGSFGCAGSNASRAARDRSRTLSLATINECSEALAADIVSHPRFKRWRDRYLEMYPAQRDDDIVMLVLEFKNNSDDPTWNVKMEDFLYDLSRHLSTSNMVLLYRSEDEARPGFDPSKRRNYIEALEDFDRQDQSPVYNQRTGQQAMGRRSKAGVGIRLFVSNDDIGGVRSFVLRAMLVDVDKTEIVSVSSQPSTR